MPWCPKCKTEYREGFTVCADCGSELVEEEPAETPAEEVEWDAFSQYGNDAGTEAENEDESNATQEDGNDMPEDAQGRTRGRGMTVPYQDSAERASDNRSSGWILLILGILGLLVLALGMLGVLPLHFGNSYLFYGVMGAIFILFVVSGGISMKNAKLLEKKAASENTLRESLHEWCRENLNAQTIDDAVGAQGVEEEILYFKRLSYIKERLNYQFMNLDQGFLDKFIDDYVYDEIFGEKE